MTIKYCLIVFLLWLHANIYADNAFRIGLSTGLGSYSLVDMKELQTEIFRYSQDYLPGLRMMEQFPGYHNISGWFDIKHARHSIGYHYAQLYTGARNSISDYSGKYKFDMLIGCYRHSVSYKFWFLDNPQAMTPSVFTFAKYGRSYSKLNMMEELEIYNQIVNENQYWYSTNGKFFELGVGSVFKIYRFLECNMTFGYDIDVSNDFREVDKSKKYLKNRRGKNVSPDWSGLRLTLGINVLLESK